MARRVPPGKYPWWVKASLIAAPRRGTMRFWVAVSLIAGALCWYTATTDVGLWRIALVAAGAIGAIVGGMYWATIRWVDRYGEWPQ